MLTSGQMMITGLNHHDQTGALKVALAGTIPHAFALLNAPPLNLLRHVPPQVVAATGTVRATVTASIPFRKRVRLANVDLRVAASLGDVRVATPFQGLALSQGAGRLVASAAC